METKANYAIVGFFTLLVVAAAFGFVYWTSQFGRSGPMAQLVIRIPGSANGLSVGSPVRFNGIPVGTVRALSIDRTDPRFSVALTEVQADAPVYSNTRAVLEIQGLTGSAYVELSANSDPEGQNILEESLQHDRPAVLNADLSSVTNLLATADKILQRADDAIGQIQTFVNDSREPLTQTVRNAQTFSQALSDNADGINTFLESVGALSTTVTGLSGRLDSTLQAIEDMVKSVDAGKVDSILSNADKVSQDIARASGELPETIESFRRTARSFEAFGAGARATLERVDALVASVDTAKIGTTVDNVTSAASDVREAVQSVRGIADDIGARRQDIDRAVANFTDMSNKLNAASNRVDGILAKVDGLLGSDDSQSVMVQARATLESFKRMADNLNAQISPIAANLSRFSGTGLRDLQTLITDTRRTMQNLDDTISNFDRNPQRLLFGGETVKEYDGRTRR
ncbi:MCE family protein [Rhizobiaceae bacterium BDR2-2]|uniref:MCE family protein n=1 Tax=Ectorhizobium quercum TaxID=2965071 RepID=A0AAE3SUR8_9HYPH|nr:MlaD family protein [Ectorhizobium quercum]MCX8997535.1 MCE family protein [Ectorhizobium quercum]